MSDESSGDVEIEAHANYVDARFLGTFELGLFKRQIDTAVRAVRERDLFLLLLDLTRLQATLSTLDRYDISSYGARAAAALKVSVLAPPELIDSQNFGIMVARNRGLKIDIFTDREKALAWLLAPNQA